YAWAPGRSPDDLALPPVPLQVLESLTASKGAKTATNLASSGASTSTEPVKGVDASPSTLAFLSGKYAEGPGWNQRLFNAACDLCGRGLPLAKAEALLLAGAKPWNLGEEEAARKTIQSAYSEARQPGKF